MNAEIAKWDAIGFKFRRATAKLNVVVRECRVGAYELCSWGGGRTYAPGYYPSGETLFAPGGELNVGHYTDTEETAAIEATIFGSSSLAAYAELTAQQLPVLFEPQAETTGEVLNTLRSLKVNGVDGLTANPLGKFMPEYLYVS
jgi:peptide/nickel transport system substrate-binding protein